jgi:hypothetical protein
LGKPDRNSIVLKRWTRQHGAKQDWLASIDRRREEARLFVSVHTYRACHTRSAA